MVKIPDSSFKVKVTGNIGIAPNVYVLSFNKPFSFKPGQIISVKLYDQGQHRLYSILSENNSNFLSILYDIKKDGHLTPQLKNLQADDEIIISAPFGEFLSNFRPNDLAIATGTGIAPFYCLLKSGKNKFTLIHGAKDSRGFYFSETFSQHLQHYIPCSSREKITGVYEGRLTKYLEMTTLSKSIAYHLCGSAEMVVDVRELLIRKGIPYSQIHTEIYF